MANAVPVGEWLVVDRVEGDEARVVTCYVSEVGLTVREVTEGEVTEAVFGEAHHSHSVRIATDKLDALLVALGTDDLVTSISDFFDVNGNALIDFEDLLDEKGVPFTYRSTSAEAAVLR